MKKCNCGAEPFEHCQCFQAHPKPGKQKKQSKTQAEKYHLGWVASQGCMICGKSANVHHIRISGEPRDHFKTIPLCYEHHQGANGIHFLGKREWRKQYGHELDMLKKLIKRLDLIWRKI